MKFKEEDIWIKSTDQRIGMGISGWHMRYEMLHLPSKCLVAWETTGSSSWKMREKARLVMELLIEDYIDENSPS